MPGAVTSPAGDSAADRLELLRRGRRRLSVELRDLRDRWTASDPGGARLRQGLRAVVAVGSTLGVEYGFALLLGAPPLLGMMIGAVVAMLMANAINENRRRRLLLTSAWAPVAACVGAALGIVLHQWTFWSLAVFVLVSVAAVWVRRFGPRWFAYGFLAWQAYFFCLFLHPPLAGLPLVCLGIVIAAAWVTLLQITALWDDPTDRLRRTVTSLRAEARSCVAAALDVLEEPDDPTELRQLRTGLIRLSEVLLLFDGQLGDARAVPEGVSARRLRRWVVDVEIRMDELVNTVIHLAHRGEPLPTGTLAIVQQTLQSLGWGQVDEGRRSAVRLTERAGPERAVARLGQVCGLLLETMDEWLSGRLLLSDPDDRSTAGNAATGMDPTPAAKDSKTREEDETLRSFRDEKFEPVITLFGGNLPGSASVATQTVTRTEARWWSPAGWRLTTRQAIQAGIAAALAIAVGELISPQRYYWAVITAFIVFTGTATSSETVRKSAGRIVGTGLGLIAAIALANLTGGHVVASFVVIMVAIFVAFYLQRVSQAAMIFFITIMLGQLYGLLHAFSDELLLLRLAETAAGGVIGALTALVVLPAGTRATLRQARKEFLIALAALLAECGDRLCGKDRQADLMMTVITLDACSRQVVRISAQLIRGRYFGSDRVGLRHRIELLGASSSTGRAIAALVASDPGRTDLAAAQACDLLRAEAERLADVPDLGRQPVREPDTEDISATVGQLLDDARQDRPAVLDRQLHRLADTLDLLTPRGRRP